MKLIETRLPGGCATGNLILAALEDQRAERASNVCRAITAAIGH